MKRQLIILASLLALSLVSLASADVMSSEDAVIKKLVGDSFATGFKGLKEPTAMSSQVLLLNGVTTSLHMAGTYDYRDGAYLYIVHVRQQNNLQWVSPWWFPWISTPQIIEDTPNNFTLEYRCDSSSGVLYSSRFSDDEIFGTPIAPLSVKNAWYIWGYTVYTIPTAMTGDYNRPWDLDCEFKATGDDLFMFVVTLPPIDNQVYQVPDRATRNAMERTFGTISVIYDLVGLMLMAGSLVLLFFIIVFIWKTFEYIASRVKMRGQ